ncbi:MAG: hypothetical protein ABIC95_07075 [archaeon]
MDEKEIRSKLFEAERKISVLEWDDKRMQINPYKKAELEKLRKEKKNLDEELMKFQ